MSLPWVDGTLEKLTDENQDLVDYHGIDFLCVLCFLDYRKQCTVFPKLFIPSTLNIDLLLWHTQLIVCAENLKSWVFPFTFQAYILPHTLFHI